MCHPEQPLVKQELAERKGTYKSAVRALIPLVITSVAVPVGLAGTLGGIWEHLKLLCPGVADAEGSTADGRVLSASDAHCNVVQVGKDSGG